MVSSRTDDLEWLYKRLEGLAGEASNRLFKFGLLRLETGNLQLARYQASTDRDSGGDGHYDWHVDRMPDKNRHGRLLSVTVQLSNKKSYKGGQVLVGSRRASGNQGDVVVFSSNMAHAVLPVTKGERYALVAWFTGYADGFAYTQAGLHALERVVEDRKGWAALPKALRGKDDIVPAGIRHLHGQMLLHQGRPADAVTTMLYVHESDARRPGFLNDIAVANYYSGNIDDAIDALAYSYIYVSKDDGQVLTNFARFLIMRYNIGSATYYLSRAVWLGHIPAIMILLTIICSCSIGQCCCWISVFTKLGWHQAKLRVDAKAGCDAKAKPRQSKMRCQTPSTRDSRCYSPCKTDRKSVV